jgi:Ycf66 protein N-terminus
MLNIGTTFAAILGLIYLILGIFYPILTIVVLAKRSNELNSLAKVLYIIQAIASPIVLLLCGLILIYQGWRLDPILVFSQFLLMVLIIYLAFKDILLNFSDRGR